jgi:uncharacterized RDD family membrane protein YckC
MTSVERYISEVLRNLPAATPQRAQIALELQGHISERLAAGLPLDDVVRQLGDPLTLAESYLSAVPLAPPSIWRRILAKLLDIAAIVVAIAVALSPVAWMAWHTETAPAVFFWLPFLVVVGGTLLFGLYTALSEYWSGQTIGKWLLGLCVVRMTGARISLGQAVVRQLPLWLQVYLIDAGFALFTENQQRAFELLSKTRVVLVAPPELYEVRYRPSAPERV